jgi:hypothetical protein
VEKPRRAVALTTAILTLASAALFATQAPPAIAQTPDEVMLYELPSIAMWDKTTLSVLVVPPNHGQIFNGENGFFNGTDPDELTPFNSYLVAIEAAIQAWKDGVDQLGAEWLKKAYQVNVFVLGRDTVPPEVLVAPDILVVTDESEATSLGTAVRLSPCVVRMSKVEIESFNYADMYNVTAQEFGHCLGLDHVGSQGGVDPTSDLKQPEHDVMNGFYTHSIGSAGTHMHCISNLDILALEFIFSHTNTGAIKTAGPRGLSMLTSDLYGDTCSAPPSNWRSLGGELTVLTTISSPLDGSDVERSALRKIKGMADGPRTAQSAIEVAVARRTGKTCRWLSATEETWHKASCEEPLWNPAVGTFDWRLRLPTKLKPGGYLAMSRASWDDQQEECCEVGRNQVQFTLN